jgi:two-component system, cell cycle sensor histidine kinase and response regulator CckA
MQKAATLNTMPSTRTARRATRADPRFVRVLVIDDDPQALPLVEMALADAHFKRSIEVTTTATVGLQRIKADEHDVYIVDHRLPDGTGISLIHEAHAAGVDKPFILITGFGSSSLDEAALNEGAADYVEKHLLSTHLERSIRYSMRNWQANRDLLDREEQLRHAQKMEGIGRLAGGVAHDFNNLLTAIIGFTDLIIERIDPLDAVAEDVREIRKAADQAAALTRQLLAFSRRQFLEPRVIDLNEVVTGLIRMLPRLIGEHIETSTRLAPHLGRVWADQSQMDQILVNLVLNARDAMPAGGRLTIETANVSLDEEVLRADGLNVKPGRYAMLAITDTGIGMDDSVRARAFEPFFTTKPHGKGTGLGLATVYGIVDQSGGAIVLDSAPGRGTAVRIYFPVTSTLSGRADHPDTAPTLSGAGTETLLLVEDNDSVRQVSAEALRRRGYTVHEARNGDEALQWIERATTMPNLLVTDIVMPGIGGTQLATKILERAPGMRVLYMSGFTEDASSVQGNFWGNIPLLQKPFTPGQLADRVRFALDLPASQQ